MVKIINKETSMNDKIIRLEFRNFLDKEAKKYRRQGHKAEVFEEFGVRHGTARIDFAIINGVMCGYEIKSDRDTLKRLPEQVEEFSAVFDRLTLVVGKRHLYKAMHIIPDWWGVTLAKFDADSRVIFHTIRKSRINKEQEKISIARLLWRNEALQILEKRKRADDVRSKPREFIYKRLSDTLSVKTLKRTVNSILMSREGWRSDLLLASHDG